MDETTVATNLMKEKTDGLTPPTLLYICDRQSSCRDNCTARAAGLRIDDDSVCQRTSDANHSLSRMLGIKPTWSVDPDTGSIWVETTQNIFEKQLVIPVDEITVEGNNA